MQRGYYCHKDDKYCTSCQIPELPLMALKLHTATVGREVDDYKCSECMKAYVFVSILIEFYNYP